MHDNGKQYAENDVLPRYVSDVDAHHAIEYQSWHAHVNEHAGQVFCRSVAYEPRFTKYVAGHEQYQQYGYA